MAKFSPLHDRILVRRVEEADTTRGGGSKASGGTSKSASTS